MSRKKRLLSLSLIFLFIFTVAMSLVKVEVFSVTTTSVYVNPPQVASTTWTPSKQFNITVNVANVADLFAWQVYLSWNSSILDFVSWAEGDFLKAQPQGTQTAEDLNQTEHPGAIDIGVSTLGEYKGVSGSGILADVTLQVKALGNTAIEFTPGIQSFEGLYTSILLDSAWAVGQPRLEDFISHATVGGSFVNVGVPEPIFTFSPSKPAANTTVTFNASASYDPEGLPLVAYAWDFGDGTNGTGAVVSQIYSKVGSYTVVLNITDAESLTNTASKTVQIRYLHNVAVNSVSANPLGVKTGESVTITVIVKNLGAATETFEVTVFYADTELSRQTVSNLAPDETKTLTFTWVTSGVAEGTYAIKAVAQTVSGETSVADNVRPDGIVEVKPGEQSFPTLLVVGGVGVVAAAGIGFFLIRRRKGVQPPVASVTSS